MSQYEKISYDKVVEACDEITKWVKDSGIEFKGIYDEDLGVHDAATRARTENTRTRKTQHAHECTRKQTRVTICAKLHEQSNQTGPDVGAAAAMVAS